MGRPANLETGYYGKRTVVYVAVEVPGRKPSKHLVVYGHPFSKVLKTVRKALSREFGANGAVAKKKRRASRG